ncbi:MAG: DegT/DnrJ/EryC1/StrS family aminotransferase [Deltaproteobacteria bacterium]|nr:DegT/DnrJ/EryC1/StrS family aminotransferase [Deltaproteobacteria bacterium]
MSTTPPLLPIVRPALGDEEVAASARVIRSGWITQGPEVLAFEGELAAAVGANHAAAVANCTVALELALRALGVGSVKGRVDEVITVSHSFIATANAVVSAGGVPVFVDVRDDDLGLDPTLLEAAITKNTRAILAVHQLGIPCRILEIVALAKKHGLPVVEDAACAIGSEIEVAPGQWQRLGRPHGDVACFSFHPRKVVTTGDGGMLTTNDAALDARFRLLRQHAMSISDVKRHSASEIVFEQYLEPAYNFRMTDLQAAVGRPQLARLASIVTERRRLAEVYRAALEQSAVLAPPRDPPGARANWQSYPTRLRAGARLGQREVMQRFLDAGIATKRGVSNAHQEPAYASSHGQVRLPVSEQLRDACVLLPLFHGMKDEEQQRVLDVVRTLS